MVSRLAFVTPEGDLALAEWESSRPSTSMRTLLGRADPALRGAGGALPLGFASPNWSPDGLHVAVSLLYQTSERQPGATLVLVGLDGGPPLVLYAGLPGVEAMIAPGQPHYVNWSPAGDQIALLAPTRAGLTLLLIGIDRQSVPAALTSGAPLFSAWSSDGQTLLIHQASDLLLLELASAPNLTTLARNASSFQVPAWSPSGDRFALIQHRGNRASLGLMDRGGQETVLHGFPGPAGALAWSPAGALLAYSSLASSEPPRYRGLWLDQLDGQEAEQINDEIIVAFFWSPDGRRLAYLTPTLSQRQMHWNVLDLESRASRRFSRFYPAIELNLLLTFFEQYSLSHRIWSPAGDALLISGRIAENGVPPEYTESHILVQPVAAGATPAAVALGTQPVWAPC